MKKLIEVLQNNSGHWVGNGFPVRSLFNYGGDTKAISPFLLFDYAGPYEFGSNSGSPRGVGQHPHRGFETVSIVYHGEVSHRDSAGGGGTIGPGDVQWMTAGGGIIHEEFHSANYSKTGGPFQMVQLWVNLPAKDKMTAPNYQSILNADIPRIDIDTASVRVIAGKYEGHKGPANTFTPINLWDVKIKAGARMTLPTPEDHTTMIAVLSGRISSQGTSLKEAQIGRYSLEGDKVELVAEEDAILLVMTGEPINEPVAGHGPFVMNTENEIRQAIMDFNAGRFSRI